MSILQDKVGLGAHHLFLVIGQKEVIIDHSTFPRLAVFHHKLCIAQFFHQHHPPGETEALFGPEQLIAVQEIPPGKEQLEEEEWYK
ncbi:hypothetical protein D3C86_1138350 [compost metagenome]